MKFGLLFLLILLSSSSLSFANSAKIFKQAMCEAIHPKTAKKVQVAVIGTHAEDLQSPEEKTTMAKRTATLSCERKLFVEFFGKDKAATGKLQGFRVLGFHNCQSFDPASCDFSRLVFTSIKCTYIDPNQLYKIDIDAVGKSVCLGEALCHLEADVKDAFGNITHHPAVKIRSKVSCVAVPSGSCPPATECMKDTNTNLTQVKEGGT